MIRTVIMLTILSVPCYSQVFRTEMDVIEAGSTHEDCFEQVTVTWGVKGNEMAFQYNQKLLRFSKFKLNSKQQRVVNELNAAHIGDYVMVMSDLGDVFLIRILETSDGMVIFMNNLGDKREHYLFDHTSVRLCETNVFKK